MRASVFFRITLIFGVVNGAIHYVADSLVNTDFVRALIIAVLSGTIAGAFGLAVAYMQRQDNKDTHERLDRLEERGRDIAGAVGANKRETDDTSAGDAR